MKTASAVSEMLVESWKGDSLACSVWSPIWSQQGWQQIRVLFQRTLSYPYSEGSKDDFAAFQLSSSDFLHFLALNFLACQLSNLFSRCRSLIPRCPGRDPRMEHRKEKDSAVCPCWVAECLCISWEKRFCFSTSHRETNQNFIKLLIKLLQWNLIRDACGSKMTTKINQMRKKPGTNVKNEWNGGN